MAGRGRPPKAVERSNILLRVPTDLIEQVETFKERLEAERDGFAINRTDLLIRLIEVGLQTLTQARQPAAQPVPASHVNGQGAPAPQPTPQPAIPLALEPAPTTAQPVDVPQATETPSAVSEPIAEQTPSSQTPAPQPEAPEPTVQTVELSEDIVKIAEVRAHHFRMSERTFAQYLFDHDIYRHRTKDGREVPIPHTTLRQWLQRAREAGLL